MEEQANGSMMLMVAQSSWLGEGRGLEGVYKLEGRQDGRWEGDKLAIEGRVDGLLPIPVLLPLWISCEANRLSLTSISLMRERVESVDDEKL